MAYTDQLAACVTVDPTTGIVRIDSVPVFRVFVIQGNGVVFQFKDPNKLRATVRGSAYIEIPAGALFEKITRLIA